MDADKELWRPYATVDPLHVPSAALSLYSSSHPSNNSAAAAYPPIDDLNTSVFPASMLEPSSSSSSSLDGCRFRFPFPLDPIDDSAPARRGSIMKPPMDSLLSCDAAASPEDCSGRNKRMMKSRESAARSRARKQAYVSELESKVVLLREENSKLLKIREQYLRLKTLVELEPKKRALRRTCSSAF